MRLESHDLQDATFVVMSASSQCQRRVLVHHIWDRSGGGQLRVALKKILCWGELCQGLMGSQFR